MELAALFNETPFVKLLGIEVLEASDGRAVARLPYEEKILSYEGGSVVQGGATYTLADVAGGAAVISLAEDVTPTVDMRIDYLAPVTSEVTAEGEVLRLGSSLAAVRVEMTDVDGAHVATAHGTYKTGGQGEATPWGRADYP